MSVETQELTAALILEAAGPGIDALAETMGADPTDRLDAGQSVGAALAQLDRAYGWARQIDLGAEGAEALFWYVSADKLEPRLGERATIPGAERESPLDIVRQVQRYAAALEASDPDAQLATLLLAAPEHRRIARRVQALAAQPYAEIRENLLDAKTRPIDLLRAKLAVFGASKFDPKSDRWTRVTLFQGAPLAEDIAAGTATDDWAFPVLG
jgi:hypothetical protein